MGLCGRSPCRGRGRRRSSSAAAGLGPRPAPAERDRAVSGDRVAVSGGGRPDGAGCCCRATPPGPRSVTRCPAPPWLWRDERRTSRVGDLEAAEDEGALNFLARLCDLDATRAVFGSA